MWMLGISIINLITEIIILISIKRISNTIKNIPGKITGKNIERNSTSGKTGSRKK